MFGGNRTVIGCIPRFVGAQRRDLRRATNQWPTFLPLFATFSRGPYCGYAIRPTCQQAQQRIERPFAPCFISPQKSASRSLAP